MIDWGLVAKIAGGGFSSTILNPGDFMKMQRYMAEVNWGLSFKIAVSGFGIVFSVLGILALVVWAVSRAIQARESKGGKSGKA